MTTYFVASGGSNTSPYDTWAKAATSLQTALTAASTNGDHVIIQYNAVPSGDAQVAADTTYTFAANVSLISASADDAGTAYTPTQMGTANWIGNSTTSRSVYFAGKVSYIYGITVRQAGATYTYMGFSYTDNSCHVLDSCYLWIDNTATGSRFIFGTGAAGANALTTLKNTSIRFGNTAQGLSLGGTLIMEGGGISPDGTAVTTLITPSSTYIVGYGARFFGVDLSKLGSGYLVGDLTGGSREFHFVQCKMGSGFVPMASQTIANQSALIGVHIVDCADGADPDKHYLYQYHNPLGSLVTDPTKYVTTDGASYDGTNRVSWKIVTTANASYANPFVTPWMSKHHAGSSPITPRIEVMRTGSAAVDGEALNDDELWVEFAAKTTAGYTLATIYSDRKALTASAAAQTTSGLGASDWTGKSTYAWYGKLEPTSAITPAEIGDLSVRICAARDLSDGTSYTVYIDPTIRGTV